MSNPYESPATAPDATPHESSYVATVARSLQGAMFGVLGYFTLFVVLGYFTHHLSMRSVQTAWPIAVLFAVAGAGSVVLREVAARRSISRSRCVLISCGLMTLCLLVTNVFAEGFGFAIEREMRELTPTAVWTRVATSLVFYLCVFITVAIVVRHAPHWR